MSTKAQKIKAQAVAFGLGESIHVAPHLISPVELGALFDRVDEVTKQRDEVFAALLGVLEEWEGGYRPEDCGTTMAIAREAIAAVKGVQ